MKHYRIRQLDEGGFFIARRTTFRWVHFVSLIPLELDFFSTLVLLCFCLHNRTLQELVEHYSKDSDGLCVNLCKPCVQVSEWNMEYVVVSL